jgi:hypothetical protein
MFRPFWTCAALLAASLLLPPAARGQFPRDDGPDMPLTPEVRTEVIDGVLKHLNETYVFPETAKKMEEAIRDRLAKKEYDKVAGCRPFAARLTDDLQAVSHDKHLRVRFSSKPIPKRERREPTPQDLEQMRKNMARQNFGFEKVERLAGNVGYLDLRGFMPADLAGDTAAGAMNFLANTDALILDLRKNGGGDPAMVALLCSYLFPAGEVVHLNDLYFRPSNETHQWWTLPYVPGKRFAGKPVYVLTSRRTFSAAEECTYNLKNQKRATIVGETTGGGAHPGGMQRINEHFAAFIPVGRAINPVSKTNWEGTGVKPDVDVPAPLALKTAHLAAVRVLAEKTGDDPDRAKSLHETITTLEKELQELKAGGKETARGPSK